LLEVLLTDIPLTTFLIFSMTKKETGSNAAQAPGNPEPVQSSQEPCSIDQSVDQSGKLGVNIGQGQGTQVGDVYNFSGNFYQSGSETSKPVTPEGSRLLQSEDSNPVNTGLNALTELMQHSEVRSAVISFRVDFQAACDQISIIANYKELHDLLHTLEFRCYSGIVHESKRFLSDETSIEILTDHELTLQETLRQVQEIAERKTIATNEIPWLKDLELAQTELRAAIKELNTRQIQRTVWLLNRILAIYPSRINTKLNEAARTLRLPTLVDAMQCIWERLAASNLNQQKIKQFYIGVEGLVALNSRLDFLIQKHDYWQELDSELRRIESNLEIELEMSWTDLKKRTEVLFTSDKDLCTASFQQDSQNLEEVLKAQNPAKIKGCFRTYRRRASERFFQVDTTLLLLCGELREVGAPLTSVLRMIE